MTNRNRKYRRSARLQTALRAHRIERRVGFVLSQEEVDAMVNASVGGFDYLQMRAFMLRGREGRARLEVLLNTAGWSFELRHRVAELRSRLGLAA